ncbi:hypothetical protein GL218_06628 [Daldinia childiae]|uniref:uncharacterized protein n=1 Tax=Daldinia childiae TaxID=326645 RepID=UPI0014481062|nr:uncharacterized protein GL218_06628 [Daldinia childiae]KAF3056256.1 hypothetical protein GL218_06628 [Daldinia childiae]
MSLPYSTLEVCGAENYGPPGDGYGNTNKEVVNHPDSITPQVAPFEVEGAAGYFPEVVNHQKEEHPSATTTPAKICGLPKRTFYIILTIGILVVIGAIAGGVAGGVSRKNYSTKHSDDSNSNDPRPVPSNGTDTDGNPSQSHNTNVLDISKLASSNMTGTDGNTYRTVFFQDTYNSIIARRWDSQNKTWETINITKIMDGHATPLNPIAGTPLASTSCDYNGKDQVHVWFITPANYISTLMLRHAKTSPNGWGYDLSGSGTVETLHGSQLAAAWQRCWSDNCPNDWGNWAVAYQTPGGDINIANSTDWQTPTMAVQARSVAENSSLALIPQLDAHDKIEIVRLNLVSEALHSAEAGIMQQTIYVETWVPDLDLIDNIPTPEPSLQFAITLLNDFSLPMFLALLPNGTVSGMWWTGTHFESIPSFNFNGGPSSVNFTAISATEEAMFYGISNDEVLQYEPDPEDLFSFKYVGRVYP